MTEPVSLLTEDELAGLKALADAATPGPWDCGRDPSHYDAPEITKADGAFYVGVKMEDAAFIAGFNPQTALRLLHHIDALKAERDGLKEELDDLEEAKTAEDVWPKWAMSVHKLLTERGVYLGDEDECHLPDDLGEYIRGFEKACEEIQHPLLAVTKDGAA